METKLFNSMFCLKRSTFWTIRTLEKKLHRFIDLITLDSKPYQETSTQNVASLIICFSVSSIEVKKKWCKDGGFSDKGGEAMIFFLFHARNLSLNINIIIDFQYHNAFLIHIRGLVSMSVYSLMQIKSKSKSSRFKNLFLSLWSCYQIKDNYCISAY